MLIGLKQVGKNIGPTLFLNRLRSRAIEQAEVLTVTAKLTTPKTFSIRRVNKVYELVGTTLTELDYVKVGRQLLFAAIPTGKIVIVPKGALFLEQINYAESRTKEVFIKLDKRFETRNINIKAVSLDGVTVPKVFFCLTKDGEFTAELNSVYAPGSFWVKSTGADLGESVTNAVQITADLFL